jgi:type II secretory pathway component GspD/PulD (secretin)
VTVNLQEVEWEPALRVILDSTGNALLEKSPGIYTIVSKSELAAEPVSSDTIFLSYATISNILPLVQSMLVSTNASVAGFPGANALIVQETVSRIKTIREVVARVDKPRDQVLIEAKFVELNDEAIKDLGINWQVLEGYTLSVTPQYEYGKTRNKNEVSTSSSSDRNQRTITDRLTRNDTTVDRDVQQDGSVAYDSGLESSGTSASFPDGEVTGSDGSSRGRGSLSVRGENFSDFDAEENRLTLIPRRDRTLTDTKFNEDNAVRTLDGLISDTSSITKDTTEVLSAILSAEQFSLTLSALKQNNGVEIVSNPKVVVASGETANIHVGRNEPNIVAVPQGDTGDRYAYQLDDTTPFIEIGVKLTVTPTLNTESNINVRIMPELSRKLADKLVGEAGTSYPVTQIRKINTEFNLESGRTVAIGGLTETDDVESVVKIPVLGDIPIIGKYLFRHTHTEKLQDEVIIFVTVSSAKPSTLAQISGIPEEGRLIHRHLAQRAEEASKAEQMKARKNKSR